VIPALAEPTVRPAHVDEADALVRLSELAVAELCLRDYSGDVVRAAVHRGLPRRAGLAYLRGVFVHPNVAGNGVGSALVRACEAAARAVGARELALGATLTGARLYTRLGYRRVGEFEVALPGCSVACVHMLRTLTGRA
jgi:GNAT superfamily N-acetyltransferase